jgi:MFS family permease
MNERSYRGYLLLVLLVILACNSVDRLALGLLLQSIKADLHLSDTQLGVLTGIAFALFYSAMGVPIARWADRGNRVVVIATTTALWSVAVALCGFAGSFAQLLLIRVGVAVGEAGCIPPAHSLIADFYQRSERPKAVAIYMLGGPLSVLVGYFLAGWLNEFYGWRTTFIILGLPGVALAVLAGATLREPRRSKAAPRVIASGLETVRTIPAAAAPATDEAPPSVFAVCTELWKNVTFRHLLFCFSVLSFFGAGIGNWQPAFFIRSYGLETGALGTWLAMIVGVAGVLGTYFGGDLASRLGANNERLQLAAIAGVYCCFAVISTFIYLSPNHYVAFAFTSLSTLAGTLSSGPIFATIQTLVPNRMRAVSLALVYLFANLVGMGLGPLAVGALSDVFRSWAGEESLRYALLAMCPGYLWAGWHAWRASATVTGDLEAVRAGA